MEIAHPLFLMKLYPKFEISEKTVSKDYSLELTSSKEKYHNPLKHYNTCICVKVLQRGLGN